MELTISKNLKQSGSKLDYWQLLYCANFNVKPKEFSEHLAKKMPELYALADNASYFNIDSSENSYLERHFQGEVAALRSRGENLEADIAEKSKEAKLKGLAEYFSGIHISEYSHFTEWFPQTEYPLEVIALLLHETLSKVYGKDITGGIEKTYIRNREKGKTIAGHMALNATTVSEILSTTQGAQKFSDVYFNALKTLRALCQNNAGVTVENVNTFGMGKWLKFESKLSNPAKYHDNVQKLTALATGTNWCTAYAAGSQLAHGDFYVFVDSGASPRPHIAVRMSGAQIGEVRGILPGQEIEHAYLPVAEEFLANNVSITGGKRWFEETQQNRKYYEFNQAILEGTFKGEDIHALLELLAQPTPSSAQIAGYYAGNNYDNAKGILLSNVPRLKPVLAEYFDVPETYIDINGMNNYPRKWVRVIQAIKPVLQEHKKVLSGQFKDANVWQLIKTLGNAVSLGDCNAKLVEAREQLIKSLPTIHKEIAKYFKVPVKDIILGDLDLADLQTLGAYVVFGNVTDIRESRQKKDTAAFAKYFERARHPSKTLKYVLGNIKIEFGLTEYFEELLLCFGKFDVKGENFKGAPNLKEIHGGMVLETTKLKSHRAFKSLKTVKDAVSLKDSFIMNMGALETVEGNFEIENTQIHNLFNLTALPDNLKVINSRMPHKLRLIEVKGNIQVKGYFDAQCLRQAKTITTQGNLFVSPLLKADNINFQYRDFSVAAYLSFRRKGDSIKADDTPVGTTFAQALLNLARRLLGREQPKGD